MPNFATATLIGHLGRDPVLRHTAAGDAVAGFSLAVNTGSKDRPVTTWWDISVWGRQADTAVRYLAKGRAVLVSGVPAMGEYQAQDGTMRQTLTLRADRLVLMGEKSDPSGLATGSDGSGTMPSTSAPPSGPLTAQNGLTGTDSRVLLAHAAGGSDDIPF